MNNYSEPIRAAELLARRISSFQSVKRTAPDSEISILDFLAAVKNRGWQNSVASIRTAFAAGNKAKADELKRATLPAVTFSGVFHRRANDGMALHSGLLCLDFDNLGDRLGNARRRFEQDSHVLAIFISPSGAGLKVLVPITATNSAEHNACFVVAESHFKQLGFAVDPSCKDVARLCFASSDSECWTASGEQKVSPFASPLLSVTEPIQLKTAPILYTTDAVDERVVLIRAQSEANRYLAEIESKTPVLVELYRQILAQRVDLGLHKRNDWLCEIAPFLFRAFSRTVAIELAVLHLKAHSGLYSGSEAEQRAAFGSLWVGLEKTYPAELSVVEFGIYEALAEPERSAFRICRDLARLDPDLRFYLGCDHLAERLTGRIRCDNVAMTTKTESPAGLSTSFAGARGRTFSKAKPIADRLGICPRTLFRWANDGKIARHKINARVVLFDEAEIVTFIESTRVR